LGDAWKAKVLWGQGTEDSGQSAEEATVAVTPFKDLPLAPRSRRWNGATAERRVRKWAGAKDEPNAKYRSAHLWYDGDAKENFTAYKMLFADIIDGQLYAVPRGVMAAAGVLDGARGGVDIPATDVTKAKSHLAKYYAKMDDAPPWSKD
jgi:hypothetical protein